MQLSNILQQPAGMAMPKCIGAIAVPFRPTTSLPTTAIPQFD